MASKETSANLMVAGCMAKYLNVRENIVQLCYLRMVNGI